MKNFTLFLAAILFAGVVSAQNIVGLNKIGDMPAKKNNTTLFANSSKSVVLTESFEEATFPSENWETNAEDVWSRNENPSTFAVDGDYYAICGKAGGYTDAQLRTPQVTVAGNSVLTFNYASLNNKPGAANNIGYAKLQLKYSTDKTTWTNLGSEISLIELDNFVWTEGIIDLSTIPAGDYYIAFSLTSDFDYQTYSAGIYLDMVQVHNLEDNDLDVINLENTKLVFSGNQVSLKATVLNWGNTTQENKVVTFKANDTEVGTATITSLAKLAKTTVEVNWTSTEAATYTLKAEVAEDDGNTNNSYTQELIVLTEGQLGEGFEDAFAFPPTNWEILNAEWIHWDSNESAHVQSYEETHQAACGQKGAYSDLKLATPKLVIDANSKINFYARLMNSTAESKTTIQLMYSEDKTTWTNVGDLIELTDAHKKYTVDLSSIPVGNYFLAFSGSSTYADEQYGGFLMVDMVTGPMIYKDDSSVEDAKTVAMDIYPNPAKDNVNIKSEENILDITVIDLAGRTVITTKENTKNVQLNTNKLSAGVYFVKIKTAKNEVIKKIEIAK